MKVAGISFKRLFEIFIFLLIVFIVFSFAKGKFNRWYRGHGYTVSGSVGDKLSMTLTEALSKGHVRPSVIFRDGGRSVKLTLYPRDDKNYHLTIPQGVTRITQSNPPVSVRADSPRNLELRAKNAASIVLPVAK